MPRLSPCKRRDFVRRLRNLGFEGPYSRTRHQFVVYREYSVPQLRMLLNQVGQILGREISPEEWNAL